MHNYCINKLINIEDVIVKKIIHSDSSVRIMLETKPNEHICPVCGKITKRIHDYKMQTIKDLPFLSPDLKFLRLFQLMNLKEIPVVKNTNVFL